MPELYIEVPETATVGSLKVSRIPLVWCFLLPMKNPALMSFENENVLKDSV